MKPSTYNRDWQRKHIYHMPVEGYPLKSCPGCGLVFQPRTRRQKYHNKACGVAYKYKLKREETKLKKRIWREKHAAKVDGDIIKIPLSGRYEGKIAITDNTSRNRAVLHGKVFSCDHYGYPMTTADDGGAIHLHHLVFGKPADGYVLDHMNGNKLDARLCNLREVTRGENNFNQPERKHNTSGKTGVHKEGNKWIAQISKDGVQHMLGRFETFRDAVEARINAEQLLYGGLRNSNPRDNRSSNLRIVSRHTNRSKREDSRLKGSKRAPRKRKR